MVSVFVLATLATVVLAAVHVTQGTSIVDARDLLGLLAGADDQGALDVLVASRLPRLLAAVVIGLAIGISGAALQSLARNPLAAPDTLAVNAGAYFAVVAAAAFGLALPVLVSGLLAFVGGLAAAGLVLVISAAGTAAPTRVILAGTALMLALSSLTTLFLLLYEQATTGLFSWGNGSLVQSGLDGVTWMAPVVGLAAIGCLLLGRRLDILALGDDTAATLGVAVPRTRLWVILLAVMLAAAAVTLAGPIGFVGLCAPVLVRLIAPRVPGLMKHRYLLPLSGIAGVGILLGADVLLRGLFGGQAGVEVPTGVVTTILGAVTLIWLARSYRDSGPARTPPGAHLARPRSARFFVVVLCAAGALGTGALIFGMLAGDTWVLLGDVTNWVQGRTGPAYTFVLDQRFPRVLAALLAGAALAVAGTAIQAVARNPLAEPGLLGVTSGAGVGAVTLLTLAPVASVWAMSAVASGSALLTFALVYGLAWRRGVSPDRLVLIGVGVSFGAAALTAHIIIATDPWNIGKALTWLSGSTYGRTLEQVVPVAIALLLAALLAPLVHKELDLLALDEDTPRVLGMRLERVRLAVLAGAALLTAAAVGAVGVVGFVGLIAPHAARALVGARHSRVIPVAALLGGILVSLADTLGRTVIAPAQIPAGLVTAMIGTPYFVWLLWRTRLTVQ